MSSDQAQEKSVLFVASLTSFVAPFSLSAVNVALPAIQHAFSVDAVMLSWIATAFLLTMAVGLVPGGRIADICGRKKIFVWGISIYTIGNLLAGLAGSVETLIAYRIFQGVGSAMYATTGMAILTSVIPPQRRGRAMGMYVSAVYIGLSVGPFVGGILTRYLGWRSVFLIVVPLGVVAVAVTLKYLKGEWADAAGEPLDLVGSLLYCLALSMMVYGSSILRKAEGPWIAAAGLMCLVAFVFQERRTRYPVFEVRLFSENKLFAFSSLAALINYATTFAITFLLSLYLQYVLDMSPRDAGMILITQPVLMAIVASISGKLSDTRDPRILASLGMAIIVVGLIMLTFLSQNSSLLYLVVILAVVGFGFGMFSSPNTNAIMGSVHKRYLGLASATVGTMRLTGQMMSMGIATLILQLFIGNQAISRQNAGEFMTSMRTTFLIFVVLCVVGVFASLARGKSEGSR